MKKISIIPILMIIFLALFINSAYATMSVKNQPLSQEPAYTYNGNDIYCIERGTPISNQYIAPGTTSEYPQSNSNNIALYTTVGEYSLPVEIAYVLTSNASLQEKQFAIWYSAMNEGDKLPGYAGETELTDLPGYPYILAIDAEIEKNETEMAEVIKTKAELVAAINNIKMQNTNINAI